MDPNTALAELQRAIDIKDFENMLLLAGILKHWIKTGGFAPNWNDHPVAAQFCIEFNAYQDKLRNK